MARYIINLGEGNPENAKIMKTAIKQLYGQTKGERIFTLADYFRQEGIQLGEQRGIKLGKKAITIELLKKGIITQEVANHVLKEE